MYSAAVPFDSSSHPSAPARRRAFTAVQLSARVASSSAVEPASVRAFTSAPRVTASQMTRASPSSAAKKRMPLHSFAAANRTGPAMPAMS